MKDFSPLHPPGEREERKGGSEEDAWAETRLLLYRGSGADVSPQRRANNNPRFNYKYTEEF